MGFHVGQAVRLPGAHGEEVVRAVQIGAEVIIPFHAFTSPSFFPSRLFRLRIRVVDVSCSCLVGTDGVHGGRRRLDQSVASTFVWEWGWCAELADGGCCGGGREAEEEREGWKREESV